MPPPRRSYATPEETFGITRRPLNDWLDFAASGLPRQGPAFSTELEDANIRNQQRELQSMQLQRDLASEEAASNFLSQAAGKNPQGLMRMLADSPEILGSKDAPMIQDYVSQRRAMQEERQARQPFSNKALVPTILKSITDPAQRMRFQQRVDAGEEATAAHAAVLDEAKVESQQVARQKAAYDALAAGAIEEADIDSIAASPDPDRALAAAMGKYKRAGKAGGDDMMIEEYDKVSTMLSKGLGDYGTPEAPENPALYKAASFLMEELNAKMEQRRARNASANPSTGAVVPQADFDAAAATATATPKATDVVTDTVVAPQPPDINRPLGAAEVASAKKAADEAAAVAESEADLNAAWTQGKDTTLQRSPSAEGVQPNRIIDFAKAAIVGGEIKGATAQEKQLASMMADYAARAAAGKKVDVGWNKDADANPSMRMRPPGYALLKELGVDPDEEITISGAGILGSDKKVPAWQLMELRLKEVAAPLRDAEAQVKATQVSDKVAKGLDVLEGKDNTLK